MAAKVINMLVFIMEFNLLHFLSKEKQDNNQ
jgi:hypothetical protein